MIAVAHLVWAPLGPEPLRSFLASYGSHDAGAEHELLVILNGLDAPGAPPRLELLAELEGTAHRLVELERPVLDLEAYRQTAARVEHESVCFLNSYAVILGDLWLGHLDRALTTPDIGLVGSTGNWESQAAWPRGAATQWPLQLLMLPRARRDYPKFPNPHVRTSSFMIERRRLLEMDLPPIVDKRSTYIIESGFASITRRVLDQGLRAVVVGRDGRAYDSEDWPASRTFRSGGQENLLISDNQTRGYEAAPPAVRRQLSRDSWGEASELP